MKSLLFSLGATVLTVAGIAGYGFNHATFAPYGIWFLVAGLVMFSYGVIQSTYNSPDSLRAEAGNHAPRPLESSWLDYLKALVCWLDAFKRTYAIEPGLYYTGKHYDPEAPLLVTSNYFLTVFLVARRIRAFNARLAVIDTNGINVWCAAAKGRFSDQAIIALLNRYDRKILTHRLKLTLILPKLSLAGVKLQALRDAHIRPVIGPIYARDLPAYLAHSPLKNRNEDRVLFDLQSRLFTWLPGLVQVLAYSFGAVFIFWCIKQIWALPIPTGIIFITAIVATAYPIFFPCIPGHQFAVKGLWLAAFMSLAICALTAVGELSLANLPTALFFTFGTAIFFGLSYSGNSAVSNYSRVRKEIARFLPLELAFYAVSTAAFVITEVYR